MTDQKREERERDREGGRKERKKERNRVGQRGRRERERECVSDREKDKTKWENLHFYFIEFLTFLFK